MRYCADPFSLPILLKLSRDKYQDNIGGFETRVIY